MSSRRVLTAAATTIAMAVCAPVQLRPQSLTQRRLEAAVVSKFPQFVEWPSVALSGRQTLDLCVAAADPVGPDLDALVANERIDGRNLAVRRIQREADVASCHVLFLSATAGPARSALLQRAAALPVLTIGDEDRFLDTGGIIRLRLVDDRIRFDVNAAAAQRVGLRISSQLLQLALTVRGA